MNKSLGDIEAMLTGNKIGNFSKFIIKGVDNLLPIEFQWNESETEYLLGNKERFPFGAKKSKRKIIFEILVNAGGHFVHTSTLANAVNKNGGYIRSVVYQINDRIKNRKLSKYIIIQPRARIGEPGAYRLAAYPDKKK